jgi:SAM-dependent methyltransferase
MQKHGALVDASDIAPELIQIAKQKARGPRYFAASADALTFAKPASYDAALAVLTLQNMEALAPVCKEIARVLKTNGTFVFVLNYPILRVPKQTSWEFDGKAGVQYRRVDAYLSQAKIPMDMHPGKTAEKGKPTLTYSFHRPLQEYIKVLGNAGFVVTHLEEWISHKISEPGPRADAENRARKEFPLFMCIAATRSGDMR